MRKQNASILSSFIKNQINVCALIGQSATVCCAHKPMEKSRVFWSVI